MLNVSTFFQQRAFGYTWLAAAGSAIQIPSGIITGISLVSTADGDISIAKIAVTDEGLSVVLMQGEKPFASVLTTEENSVVTMVPGENCVSAVINTGAFMTARFSFIPQKDHPQYIRRCFLTVTDPIETRYQEFIVNGDHYSFAENLGIVIDDQYLTYWKDEEGCLVIGIRDDYKQLFQPTVSDILQLDAGMIYSICGIGPDEDGSIILSVIVNGEDATLSKESDNCIGLYSNTELCERDDAIDLALSPEHLGESTKRPLDDAYTKDDETGHYVRDYVKNLMQGKSEEEYFKLDLKYDIVEGYGDAGQN